MMLNEYHTEYSADLYMSHTKTLDMSHPLT